MADEVDYVITDKHWDDEFDEVRALFSFNRLLVRLEK
jgi:hypothetical protein